MTSSCISCGAEMAEGSRYCQACGSPQWVSCATCGSEQPGSAAFCSACGSALQAGARRALGLSDQEERRVVSILFADLAGSTALGERLDPEDVRVLQSDLFELVNAEVERYGGVTEKFIGDAILAVFGAPQAHEDDAERAVRAALAVREAFPTFAARVAEAHGAEVGLRIGVNTGDVISSREAAARGELIVTGDAVNVAARLQQLAEPGEVLVGDRTRQASARAIAYRERGELDAKGKALPLRAWSAMDAVTAPGTDRTGSAGPLIGRADELALLRLAATRVERERSPQLVTVFGQAGVGKSRLVSEFVGGLDEAHVLVGRCVPYGDGITYLPLAEVARALAGIHEDDPADTTLERLRASVAEVVPDDQRERVLEAVAWTMGLALPGHLSGIGVGGEIRRALHDAWTKYLAALGRRRLLVLVVEDIHWASEPLLDLLDDAIDALEDTAVLIVCPSRTELLDARPSWGTGRLNASSLTLSPLSSSDAESLLRALLGSDAIPEEVASRVLAPAEGNPFFLEEMLAMLVEQGAIERHGETWIGTDRLALSVPDSIHGVIAARLDLLDAREREALRQCSVMGRSFWPSAVGVDDDIVASLGRRAIVSEQPESAFSGRREFAFKHALTHEVAYATLPRTERRHLHQRVAGWITDSIPHRHAETMELIAYHYEQALRWGETDDQLRHSALEAALGAGDAAVRRGAYASAEHLLTRALELASTDEERSKALLMAAQVDVHNRQYQRALDRLSDVVGMADAAGDAKLRADALGLRARAAWLGGFWAEGLRAADDAVATLEGLPESPELARALARLSQIQMLRALSDAEETSRRAIEVARRMNEPAAEVNARINLFTSEAAYGRIPEFEDVSEVIDSAVAAGAHDEAVRAVVNYLWSAALLGPIDPPERVVKEHLAKLERGLASEGFAQYLKHSLATLVYVPAGRWEEADATLTESDVTVATNRLVWIWLLTGQALRRGDLELVDRYLPEFREVSLATEEPQRILPMAGVAMPRAVIAGDADEVRRLADIVLGLRMTNFSSSAATLPVARSLAAVGESEGLGRLVEVFTAWYEGNAGAVTQAARGLLARLEGEHEESVRILTSVEDELRGFGRHYDAACIALDLAASLEAGGLHARAEETRARARALLEPLGCVYPY